MNGKMIQSRIQKSESIFEISILQSEWCCAYMQLDMLEEGIVGETCFCDSASGGKVSVKKAADGRDMADGCCMFLTDDTLDCIKRLISQCWLNPHDAKWLHTDIEMMTVRGEDAVLCIRF